MQAVVSALGAHLVSEHSLAEQDEIMVGGLCPQADDLCYCIAMYYIGGRALPPS